MRCLDIEEAIGKIFINDVLREDVQLGKKFILFVSEMRGTNNVTELGQISFMPFYSNFFLPPHSAGGLDILDQKVLGCHPLSPSTQSFVEQRKHCSGYNNMCMQILTQTKNRTMTSFGLL